MWGSAKFFDSRPPYTTIHSQGRHYNETISHRLEAIVVMLLSRDHARDYLKTVVVQRSKDGGGTAVIIAFGTLSYFYCQWTLQVASLSFLFHCLADTF